MKKTNKESNIVIKGARVHNLKNIDVDIPQDKLTVITGLSGSGKSSLAFDTLYAEGQRRYVESLSSYARQFLGIMNKPPVDSIKGLSPAISIEQKSISHNPRSTVGTITEIYDYLRLLYARIGTPHCPYCNKEIRSQDAEKISKTLLNECSGKVVKILSPLVRGKKGNYEKLFVSLNKQGYSVVRVNGEVFDVAKYIGDKKINLKRYKQHNIEVVVDNIKIETSNKTRLQRSLETALKLGSGLVMVNISSLTNIHNVGKKEGEEKIYSQYLSCTECDFNLEKLEPRMFSFNSPFGACPTCHGLGFIQKFEQDLIIPDKSITLEDGAISPQGFSLYGFFGQMLVQLSEKYKFKLNERVEQLSDKVMNIIMYGSQDHIDWHYDSKSSDNTWEWTGRWEGIIPRMERLYKKTTSEKRRAEMGKFMTNKTCTVCSGARLKAESLAVTIDKKNISQLSDLSINEMQTFLLSLKLNETKKKIGKQVLKEITDRLTFLIDVGLNYLTLSRSGGTLSGGEAQRIRLATQIGSELRGVMYVLDEPSIGLHQRDNQKLIKTLKDMRDLGNTVIVVEHDEETMMCADHLIDIGPGAGVAGGRIVSEGTPQQVANDKKSITGDYLSGRKKIAVPKKRRKPHGFINLWGASENNLKQVDASFPIEVFCCITGVSGSGKSTLISDTLYPILARRLNRAKIVAGAYKKIDNYGYVDKAIIIDQSPIGRTPRSNPATYTGVFTYIREIFSMTKEAKIRGYKMGRFSFNVDGGRCANCSGDGTIKIEMHFLPDVYVQCEQCKGKRYNEETLQVTFKDKNIADILSLTVDEALVFFKNIPKVYSKMKTLVDVGLGYIKLGQSATTLSGGEAQRIKLTAELSKRGTGRTLYILDEPTTGLHFEDVKKLLQVLNRLVDKGNSVIVIEHNLDVIKSADYIIDLGPDGGNGGGEIIAKGTPEEICKSTQSYTASYLKKLLK